MAASGVTILWRPDIKGLKSDSIPVNNNMYQIPEVFVRICSS